MVTNLLESDEGEAVEGGEDTKENDGKAGDEEDSGEDPTWTPPPPQPQPQGEV